MNNITSQLEALNFLHDSSIINIDIKYTDSIEYETDYKPVCCIVLTLQIHSLKNKPIKSILLTDCIEFNLTNEISIDIYNCTVNKTNDYNVLIINDCRFKFRDLETH